MRVFVVLAVLTTAVAVPTCVLPQTAATGGPLPTVTVTGQAVGATDAKISVNLDEIECRTVAPTTGTRLGGGRECHTLRQWRQQQTDAQNALMKEQNLGYNSTAAGH